MAAIAGILFDKDGTLLDFHAAWRPAYQSAAEYLHKQFGARATAAKLLAAGGYVAATKTWRADSVLAAGGNEDILRLWESVIGAQFDAAMRRDLGAIFARAAENFRPTTPALQTVMQKLHARGLILGVATMDTEAGAHRMLRRFNLTAYVDFVCGADSGYAAKPAADMAHAFCAARGLRPEQIAVVGDTLADLQMARAAGAGLVVGVLSGAGARETLSPYADLLINDIGQLPDKL